MSKPVQPTKKSSTPIQIPIAERLIIDLRNDSSDSSDDDDNGFEDSVTALLKSARQTVESKDLTTSQAIPQVLSHLPRNQQEEYQRLKEEIFRRENQRVKGSKPVPSPLMEANNDPVANTPVDNAPVALAPSPKDKVAEKSVEQQSVNVKSDENVVPDLNSNEKAKAISTTPNQLGASNSLKDAGAKAAESSTSPRLHPLKQQLLRKK